MLFLNDTFCFARVYGMYNSGGISGGNSIVGSESDSGSLTGSGVGSGVGVENILPTFFGIVFIFSGTGIVTTGVFLRYTINVDAIYSGRAVYIITPKVNPPKPCNVALKNLYQ